MVFEKLIRYNYKIRPRVYFRRPQNRRFALHTLNIPSDLPEHSIDHDQFIHKSNLSCLSNLDEEKYLDIMAHRHSNCDPFGEFTRISDE